MDLVQVDATVTDAKGRQVANLKSEDFEVLEDGKPRKITNFSYVQGDPPRTAGEPNLARPARTAGDPNLAPPRPLERNRVHRTLVIIADNFAFAPEDIPAVRQAIRSFVDRQMQDGDLVSIMTTAGGISAGSPLTNDKRQLYASIDLIRYVPGSRTGMNVFAPIKPASDANPDFAKGVEPGSSMRPSMTATMSSLAYAIRGLQEMPGRKAVALFSDGFAGAMAGIIRMANRSSVVIYTFDPGCTPDLWC